MNSNSGDKKRGQATFLGEAKGARPHFAARGGLIVLSQDGSSRPLSLTSIGDVTPRGFITLEPSPSGTKANFLSVSNTPLIAS